MITRSWLGRIGTVTVLVTFGLRLAPTATAQTPVTTPAASPSQGVDEIAVDPITCWWKTGTNAVHLGEHFTLTLTCGLADTGRVTVVPDVKSLEPTTVQLAPFEVVRGVRHQDIHIQESPWRYLQYEYTLRLLPAFIVTSKQIREFLGIFEEVLGHVSKSIAATETARHAVQTAAR